MNTVDALKACSLFKGFTDTGLLIVGGIAGSRAFPARAPLFVENMIGDSMLIIAQGQVRLTAKNAAGEEVELGELGPGDYLGELALVGESQRLCTATALTQVAALEVRQADFQKLLSQKPQACIKLLMGVIRQFGQKVVENRAAFKQLVPQGPSGLRSP
jgi:CRP-like cAMP-binding protein